MSAYLSNLLTHTTSRYNSLRRTLLSNEDDGDTDDDSHITRVLRAYYLEKGRPFPPWLPPDPKDRRSQPAPYQQAHPSASSGWAGNRQVAGLQSQANNSNRSSLSDLWDSPSSHGQAAPQQPTSLRTVRRGAPTQGGAVAPAPPQHGGHASSRPLPSQRTGSYQSTTSQHSGYGDAGHSPSMAAGAAGGGTAQERLKARLWGGRGGTPPPGSNAPFAPPPPSNQYDTSGRGYR